jgi:hypothetical protein
MHELEQTYAHTQLDAKDVRIVFGDFSTRKKCSARVEMFETKVWSSA